MECHLVTVFKVLFNPILYRGPLYPVVTAAQWLQEPLTPAHSWARLDVLPLSTQDAVIREYCLLQ